MSREASSPSTDVVLAVASRTEAWRDAFQRLLPQARLHLWPQGPDIVDFAVVLRPPSELFERVRIKRAIFNLGAGVDNLIAMPATPRDVPIVRLEDAGMAEQMAEYVTLAVLRAYREADAYAAQQCDGVWEQRSRLPKTAFSIGFLGFGVLGQAVTQALRTFAFPVLAWRRSPAASRDVTTYTGEDGLRELLAQSRVLVVMLPSTPATAGLLNRRTLSWLPRGAHIVNVARGALVVEPDLLALLDEGHIASATLDVFATEPLPAGHPFWLHPRIVVTPHVSALTLVDESAAQIAAKLVAMCNDAAVSGVVDARSGY